MNIKAAPVVPFSLKDAPSLIERVLPSMKISSEAQKERKAVQSQLLTSIASYWKGRKPLFLARACVLGSLLPATDDVEGDLQLFEQLLRIDDASFADRLGRGQDLETILRLPYNERIEVTGKLSAIADRHPRSVFSEANRRLSTSASNLAELIEQLGIMRFGRRPRVADTFSGGGSIPYEAARLGCDVYASDLNPIACMLTWGAVDFLSKGDAFFDRFNTERTQVITRLQKRLLESGFEASEQGHQARIYLYCVEALDRSTGWRVPMSPSWVLHEGSRTILKLVPDQKAKRFLFEVVANADDVAYTDAQNGTVQSGSLVYEVDGLEHSVSLQSLRGDSARRRGALATTDLRLWEKSDIVPRVDDIYGERLCAVKWTSENGNEYFLPPTEHDVAVEARIISTVSNSLSEWQNIGLVPDMPIESGDNTDQPIREKGWTHWHHLFNARQLLMAAWLREEIEKVEDADIRSGLLLIMGKMLNRGSRLCRWQAHRAISADVFYNQALNTFYNYGCRASSYFENIFNEDFAGRFSYFGTAEIKSTPAARLDSDNDIYITDPPYADAVNYHEITEFFIAWFRKCPPETFANWHWDSRRKLATKGRGEEFRSSMIEAYKAMADHMPDNGVQIVMFTHQDGKVWSDMAQIFWGAGLQVMADWYIATETTTELKKGGYVQGTHIIVLRKRAGTESGYSDEITQEVKDEVARQIEDMVGLNQSLRGHGRSENLFNDADLQMAGYAAALRVLTKYVKIDGKDMTVEALRPRATNERTLIDDIIEYAVQVANEHLVPEGMGEQTWRKLTGTERFYLKMMDIETTGSKKVDNYQNFAKAFRVADYGDLMSSVAANGAALKRATDFGKRHMGGDEFGSSLTRAVLYALWEMQNGVEDDLVIGHIRDLASNYLDQRSDLQSIAGYIAEKRKQIDLAESQNATILVGLIKNERLG